MICRNLFLSLFFSCFISGICSPALAQSSVDFVSYISNSPIAFNLNTPGALQNQQVITDAFCLSTQCKSKDAYYYVSATSTTSTTTPMPVSNMILSFYSTNCPSGTYSNLNSSDIPLSTGNQLLFQQARQHVTAYNFCYSVKIPAMGASYNAGTYTFNITFTMTEP
jgi:hypothetical protein